MLTGDAIVGLTPGDNVSIENHNWDNLLSISLSAKDLYWKGQAINSSFLKPGFVWDVYPINPSI